MPEDDYSQQQGCLRRRDVPLGRKNSPKKGRSFSLSQHTHVHPGEGQTRHTHTRVDWLLRVHVRGSDKEIWGRGGSLVSVESG